MTEKQYGGQTAFGHSSSLAHAKDSKIETKTGDKAKSNAELEEDFEEISEKDIKDYIKAGEIAKKVVIFAKNFVKKDMLLIEIAEKIEGEIEKLGGKYAFPVNLSLNENAAHYTPGLNDTTKTDGLLKIDFGVSVNGKIADVAFSLDFSEDKKFTKMIEINEKALEFALSKIKFGAETSVIGNAIEEYVKDKSKSGYNIIMNLSGHSLGHNEIHSGLTIPNIKNDNNFELKEIAFAIEPFLTTSIGEGKVYDGKPSEIYILRAEGNTRDSDARKILAFIKEEYETKPFAKRWIEKKGFKKVDFALREMTKAGILHNYPVLVESGKQPVSQAEHTVLVLKDKVIVTTK